MLIGDATWAQRLEGTYLVLTHDEEEGYYAYQIQGDTLAMQDECEILAIY